MFTTYDDKCPVKHDAQKAIYRTVRLTHGQFQIHLGSYLHLMIIISECALYEKNSRGRRGL